MPDTFGNSYLPHVVKDRRPKKVLLLLVREFQPICHEHAVLAYPFGMATGILIFGLDRVNEGLNDINKECS